MKIFLLIFLILTPLNAQAEITRAQEEADCKNIKNIALAGDKYYKLKQYTKAREQYEQQSAWSESCQLDEGKIATAYNNVALTYIQQSKFLKAKAWIDISPKDKKSIYNLSTISKQVKSSIKKLASNPEGEYWQYAGRSLWSVIEIKKVDSKYNFKFNGYYATLMTMYYGPNLGEFSTILDINNGKAHYSMEKDNDGLNCVYDFTITKEKLSVEKLSGDNCGFGHNVSAEGLYYKVEK